MLIAENLDYLITKHRMSQDDFGKTFGLKRGVIGQYLRKSTLPKIETLILICEHFDITLDEFVREDMSQSKKYNVLQGKGVVSEYQEPSPYETPSMKYVVLLEQALVDKDKIIEQYEAQLQIKEKSESA